MLSPAGTTILLSTSELYDMNHKTAPTVRSPHIPIDWLMDWLINH